MATLEIWPKKKKLGDEKVHLTLTFSKIRLEMLRWNTVIAKRIFFCEYQIVTPLLFHFKLKSFRADKLLPVCPQPEVT